MTLHPEHVHPTPGMRDALAELVQAVRMPERFRRRKPRRDSRQTTHVVEWLEDGQVEPLRPMLEPVVREALRGVSGRAAREGGDRLPVSGWAVFDLLADCIERPEELLEVDVEDAVWSFGAADDGRFERCPIDRMRAIRALEIAVATTEPRPKERSTHAA